MKRFERFAFVATALVAGFIGYAGVHSLARVAAQDGQPVVTKLRGARPSPRHKLISAPRHQIRQAPPAQCSWVPKQLSMWGNSQFGDCVSAEEAFAKATYSPEIFIPEATVIAWARRHGVLNGADLSSVMDAMQKDGFVIGGQTYNDGPYTAVDYSNEAVLQSAISQGPVKVAIDANALPNSAGDANGWYSFGQGKFPNTDHCISICGYGPASFCFQVIGAVLPNGVDPSKPCYLAFTWNTIGVVDHPWIMGTVVEAWERNPTTVGVPPLPTPSPAVVTITLTTDQVQSVLAQQGVVTITKTTTLGDLLKLLAAPPAEMRLVQPR